MKRTLILTLLFLAAAAVAVAQDVKEVTDSRILSFEQGAAPVVTAQGSDVEISADHFKHGAHSLRWHWSESGASLSIKQPVGYLAENPNPKETSVSTFIFWLYSAHPQSGYVRFEFLRDGKVCSWFDYGIAFEGWRGAWIAFDRDMQGTPDEAMDELRITAPEGACSGELFLDHIILSSFQDSRHHTADFQAPFINADNNSHWLLLLRWWNVEMDVDTAASTSSEEKSIRTIEQRLESLLMEGRKPHSLDELRRRFRHFAISQNTDGTMRGKNIWFVRYAETYINMGYPSVRKLYSREGVLLQQYNALMLDIAVAFRRSDDGAAKSELRSMYIDLTRHILDQGYCAGSAMGTLHHLGYSMRDFYSAPYLMRDVLREEGLAERVQQAMEWFSGLGEVKTAPEVKGMDIDAFNTSLMGRVTAVMILPDGARKTTYVRMLSRWIDNGLQYVEGTDPCFKSDGTVYHHRRHYPAYATGGFNGAVNAVWLLAGTDFRIGEVGHANLKRALLEMGFYCNLRSFPLAMSGRHPDGKGALIPRQYARLAEAGTPDGGAALDPEMASEFMRLADPNTSLYKRFAKLGFSPASTPEGCRVYPYNSSLSMRRDGWLLTAAGHSRYLWAAEIYQGANHYGRYLTHGSLQLLGDGDPVSAFGSGFRQEGWDWCHIPGTTAAVIPMERMKADVRNVDTFSGYEEMLLSDEAFAGGVTHRGKHGAYAMILHEHDKYNGTLRGRKSFFFIDNSVIAVGSGIENGAGRGEVHTTLFQNAVKEGHDGYIFGAEKFSGIGHRSESRSGARIVDNFGALYEVADGRVVVQSAHQHSLHEETDAPTEGDFMKGYIVHGEEVAGGGYLYRMTVKPTPEQLRARKCSYRVLQRDSRAHIVEEFGHGIHALSLFEAGHVEDKFISEVSHPVVIMYSDNDDKTRCLSMADPDLRLYEGPADERFDSDGKRIERSVYSRTWLSNPCGESEVKVVVKGRWALEKDDAACRATVVGNNTELLFTCREGATREVTLRKIK